MIRHELVDPPTPELEYSFIGAIAIHKEMHQRGFDAPPSLRTINRILKERGLVVRKPKSKKPKSKKYYPEIRALYPNHRHELDLVTPRYISGYGRVVAVNRIDVFSNRAHSGVYRDKAADTVIVFLIADWKAHGIPIYLQVDNEASFRGGMYHPRSFGKLIRFCLNFGVELIFIPWKEPWRNPYIENFNGNFNRLLWEEKTFQDLEHMRREDRRFLLKHNQYQDYKKGHFSKAEAQSHTLRFLPDSFSLDPDFEFPVTKGKLHFVRWVGEDGTVVVLNESFQVGKELSFEYVWVTIDTENQTLSIYHQADQEQKRILVKEHEYKLREPVKDRIPVNKFC